MIETRERRLVRVEFVGLFVLGARRVLPGPPLRASAWREKHVTLETLPPSLTPALTGHGTRMEREGSFACWVQPSSSDPVVPPELRTTEHGAPRGRGDGTTTNSPEQETPNG